METHEHDPTIDTDDVAGEDPWDAVSSEFGHLKQRLAGTYRKVADDHGPTEDEIRAAFATLAGAWDQVAESVSTALRDPEVREQLKSAASSFASALGTTISELGIELRDGVREDGSEEEE